MAEIVSLTAVRKARVTSQQRVVAAANAVKFGRGKALKAKDKLQSDRAKTALDGKKLT